MSILLISDVHLCKKSPNIIDGFLYFLRYYAKNVRTLYILGDLFEIWLGDDYCDSLHINVAKALRQLSQKNVSCYFIHGNRDFLLGNKYAHSCGMQLLPSQKVLKLASGKKIVILHGDILYANDHSYQLLRKYLRHVIVQKFFLSLPLCVRLRIFDVVRSYCKKNISTKKLYINLNTAIKILIRNDANIMIHGHTHQPAIHKLYKSEKNIFKIMVLGCWKKYGSMIKIDEENDNIKFIEFPLT